MNLLALDTTGKYGSAAVLTDEGIFVASSDNEMNHLRDVISLTDEALKMAGIKKSKLTHVAASVGPGSFTGIRIGVTTARTLAQMLDLPCIAISSLEGMERRVETVAEEHGCGVIVTIINARRNQTYAGLWELREDEDGNIEIEPVLEEKQYMIDEILTLAKEILSVKESRKKMFITGDGIDAYGETITEILGDTEYEFADESLRYQSAESIAELARFYADLDVTISYEKLLPNYMRLSEAEQRLKEGTLSSKISKLK